MTISDKFLNMAYRELMPIDRQEQATKEAAAYVYALIKGYDNFMNLEEAINAYSAELWKPEPFSARQYADMGLDEIEVIVRAKEEARRGRKLYSIGEIVEHIWIESITPDLPEGMDLLDDLEDLIPDLPDLSDLGIMDPGDGLDEAIHSRQRRH